MLPLTAGFALVIWQALVTESGGTAQSTALVKAFIVSNAIPVLRIPRWTIFNTKSILRNQSLILTLNTVVPIKSKTALTTWGALFASHVLLIGSESCGAVFYTSLLILVVVLSAGEAFLLSRGSCWTLIAHLILAVSCQCWVNVWLELGWWQLYLFIIFVE